MWRRLTPWDEASPSGPRSCVWSPVPSHGLRLGEFTAAAGAALAPLRPRRGPQRRAGHCPRHTEAVPTSSWTSEDSWATSLWSPRGWTRSTAGPRARRSAYLACMLHPPGLQAPPTQLAGSAHQACRPHHLTCRPRPPSLQATPTQSAGHAHPACRLRPPGMQGPPTGLQAPPTWPAGLLHPRQQLNTLLVAPVVQDPGQHVQVGLREGVREEVPCNTARRPCGQSAVRPLGRAQRPVCTCHLMDQGFPKASRPVTRKPSPKQKQASGKTGRLPATLGAPPRIGERLSFSL